MVKFELTMATKSHASTVPKIAATINRNMATPPPPATSSLSARNHKASPPIMSCGIPWKERRRRSLTITDSQSRTARILPGAGGKPGASIESANRRLDCA